MSEVKSGGYFEPIIKDIEHEKELWDELCIKLQLLLEREGEVDNSYVPAQDSQPTLCLTRSVESSFDWSIYIYQFDPSFSNSTYTNRWGLIIDTGFIIDLYIEHDNQPPHTSIADHEKSKIVCSPLGVIDGLTGEHLSVTDIERLIADSNLGLTVET